MADVGSITVQLRARTAEFKRDLDRATADARATATKIGAAFGAITGIAVGGLAVKAINEAKGQQLALAQLSQALRNVGLENAKYLKALTDQAGAYQRLTTFSDDAINSVQRILLTIGGGGDAVEKLTKTVLDFAAGTGRGLEESAVLIARAAQGNTIMLGRMGIAVEKTADRGKQLIAVQTALAEKFGGQADARVRTFTGQLERLGNAFNEALESAGAIVVESPAVQAGLRKLSDGAFDLAQNITSWYEANQTLIDSQFAEWIDGLGSALSGLPATVESATGSLRSFIDTWNAVPIEAKGAIIGFLAGGKYGAAAGAATGFAYRVGGLKQSIEERIIAMRAGAAPAGPIGETPIDQQIGETPIDWSRISTPVVFPAGRSTMLGGAGAAGKADTAAAKAATQEAEDRADRMLDLGKQLTEVADRRGRIQIGHATTALEIAREQAQAAQDRSGSEDEIARLLEAQDAAQTHAWETERDILTAKRRELQTQEEVSGASWETAEAIAAVDDSLALVLAKLRLGPSALADWKRQAFSLGGAFQQTAADVLRGLGQGTLKPSGIADALLQGTLGRGVEKLGGDLLSGIGEKIAGVFGIAAGPGQTQWQAGLAAVAPYAAGAALVFQGFSGASSAASQARKGTSVSNADVQRAGYQGFGESIYGTIGLGSLGKSLAGAQLDFYNAITGGGVGKMLTAFGIRGPTAGTQLRRGIAPFLRQVGFPQVVGGDAFTALQKELPAQYAQLALDAGAGALLFVDQLKNLPKTQKGKSLGFDEVQRRVTNTVLGSLAAAAFGTEDAAEYVRKFVAATEKDFGAALARLQALRLKGRITLDEERIAVTGLNEAFNDLPKAIDAATLSLVAFGTDGASAFGDLERVTEDAKAFFQQGIPAAIQAAVDSDAATDPAKALADSFAQTFITRLGERFTQADLSPKLTEAVVLSEQAAAAFAAGNTAQGQALLNKAGAAYRAGQADFMRVLGPVVGPASGFVGGLTGSGVTGAGGIVLPSSATGAPIVVHSYLSLDGREIARATTTNTTLQRTGSATNPKLMGLVR